ncbi:phosphoribosylaminoimidazolesuccinocarboxamide synthase [Candidatus Uhrbacteria bacterium]|nr:phosphoribosylaminoimidazolesuccinocarboxamide synthase [Candidatus Uhrbacteria bacterium]
MSDEQLREALKHPLLCTDFPYLGTRYQGKVRDSYVTPDGVRIMITTDRLSAFDRVLCTIPFKGQVLHSMTAFWMYLLRHIIPNHMVNVPDPNVVIASQCEPLQVEFVVRGYLTGSTSTSIWTAYARGDETFCGHLLPNGMRKHGRLNKPIVTPSTKAKTGAHDVSLSGEELIQRGLISGSDFGYLENRALALYAAGVEHCAQRGLILVDTKYEFGRTPDGELLLIDEVHTPDSSRFWETVDYEARFAAGEDPRALDKEYARMWLTKECGFKGDGPIPEIPDEVRMETARRYIAAYERIVGAPFIPETSEPLARIKANLASA